MTTALPFLIITTMTLCSFGGGVSFGKFIETRDVLWLIAGYSLYSLSNLSFLMLIDQSGLSRALVIGSAASILLTSAASHFYFSENIGLRGVAAAILVIVAAFLIAREPTSPPPPKSTDPTHKSIEV